MTFKRALAIGGLSILAITLTIFGLNTNAFKHKKAEESNALSFDDRPVTEQPYGQSEIISVINEYDYKSVRYNTLSNKTAESPTYGYIERSPIYNIGTSIIYYNNEQHFVSSFQPYFIYDYMNNEWNKIELGEYDETQLTTITQPTLNVEYIEYWVNSYTISNNRGTINLAIRLYTWNTNTATYNYVENALQTHFDEISYNWTENLTIPARMVRIYLGNTINTVLNIESEYATVTNSTYTFNTFTYDSNNDRLYYTATGNFNSNQYFLMSNDQYYNIQAQVLITTKQKTYYNTLAQLINGYETDVNINIINITNRTTGQTLTQQVAENTAIIYSEETPNEINIYIHDIQTNKARFLVELTNINALYGNNYATTTLTQPLTTETITPNHTIKLAYYSLGGTISSIIPIIEYEKEESYNTGIQQGNGTTEIIPLQDVMYEILTMPFTFLSQAFNVTLWPGTQYAFNVGNFIKAIIAISAILFIIKVFTSGFAVMGNFNTKMNSKVGYKKPMTSKPTKTDSKKE